MAEGNIESGSSRTKKEKEHESEVGQERIEEIKEEDSSETSLKNPEKWVKEAVDELEVKEGKESKDVQKWVDRTIQEIVDDENNFEDKERTEKWVKEVVKELLEDERKEVPTPEEPTEPTTASQPWEIRSKDDLEESLERHPELPTKKNFDKLHEDAVDYLESDNKDELETPELVKELEYRDLRRAYEAEHGGPPEVSIESMKDVDDLLETHSVESERMDFEERNRFSKLYFQIKDDHSMKRDEIAETYDVSKGFVTNAWNDMEPAQIRQLRGLEEDRIMKEWMERNPEIDAKTIREFQNPGDTEQLEPSKARESVHHVESQVIRESLEPLKDTKKLTAEDMVTTIEHMVKAAPDENYRFHCADLRSEIEDKDLKQLEHQLQSNREEIEAKLTKNLGLEDVRARVALVEGKMYIWVPKHRPDELVKAYEDQFYYFKDNKEVIRVIDEFRKELGIEGNLRNELKHMTDVVKQFMEGDEGSLSRKKPLDNYSTRIEGKVLRMYLDATDKNISDMEGRITKVAGISGRAGVENPRFPEGEKLEELKARLAAIIASDCHLFPTGRAHYNEAHLSRIDRVQENLREFGDITLEPKFRRGLYEMHVPCQVGLIMIDEGMTPGNKTINNPGLPSGYMEWSDRAKRAYLEELIPEDGCFSNQRFSWWRSHAIYVDKQKENYDFNSEIGLAEVELVKTEGHQETGLIPKSYLSITEIEDLQDHDDPAISQAAKNLFEVVYDSTNNLIDDETHLAKSLGLGISLYPRSVSYYPRSGRVSVGWIAVTTSQIDTIRWAEICPPNDVRKSDAVRKWQRTTTEHWVNRKPWKNW